MKFLFLTVCAVSLSLLTGCSKPLLEIGEYHIVDSGREDFIVAYNDNDKNIVFLKVLSPEQAPGSLRYWNWAGSYSLSEGGELIFDMDRETRKRWNFYFTFLKKRDGIVLNDLTHNRGHLLRYRIPEKRANARPAYLRTGSTGTDPNYTPIPLEE